MIILHNAIGGQDTDKFPFPFLDRRGKSIQALLTLNKRVSPDGQVTGAFCFLQTPSLELQQALEIQRNRRVSASPRGKSWLTFFKL